MRARTCDRTNLVCGVLLAGLLWSGCSKSEPETKPAAATADVPRATPAAPPAGTPAVAATPAPPPAAAPSPGQAPAPVGAASGEFKLPDLDLTKLSAPLQTKIGEARYRARRSSQDAPTVAALGALCYVHDVPEGAVASFRHAIAVSPSEHSYWYYLGRTYEKTKDKAQAVAAYEKMLAIKDYPPARRRLAELRGEPPPPEPVVTTQPSDPNAEPPIVGDPLERALFLWGCDLDTMIDAAIDAGGRGEFARAYGILKDTLELDETGVRARTGRGFVLSQQGKFDEAIVEFDRVLALPEGKDHLPARTALLSVLTFTKRYDRAVPLLREAIEAQPEQAEVANSLAWILATHPDPAERKPEEAVKLAERAVGLTRRQQHPILDTLAVAYAAAGRFEDAKKAESEAITLAEQVKKSEAVASYRHRLQLYEVGKPFYETK